MSYGSNPNYYIRKKVISLYIFFKLIFMKDFVLHKEKSMLEYIVIFLKETV